MNSYVYWPGRSTARWLPSREASVAAVRAPLGLRLLFLLFVFTVPIEALNQSLRLGPISLARFAGLALFGVAILHARRSFSVVPLSLWFFGIYLAIYAIMGLLTEPMEGSAFRTELFTLIQLISFFWIGSNLLGDQKFSGQALVVYALATALLGVGIFLNLPGFAQENYLNRIEGVRVTAMGANPNYLGFVFSVAVLIFVGSVSFKKLRTLFLVLPLIVVLGMQVQTASRGAVVSLLAGVSCFFIALGPVRRRPVVAIFAGLGIAGLLYFVVSNPDFMTRWMRTSEGESAGRDRILRNAFPMLSERPFFGWGPIAYRDELTTREKGFLSTDWRQTPHNFILETLLQVGIVGAIPFFVALILLARKAWKARNGALGMLPLALLMLLFIGNQFHQFTATKPMWLVLAVCAAASGPSRKPKIPNRVEYG